MQTSRFFTESDPRLDEVVLPIPVYWWSRPYEYAWASHFARGSVLDAACGICHPFKFYLAEHSEHVIGCDLDPRILQPEAIYQDIVNDFGVEAADYIREQKYLEKVTLVQADLTALPFPDRSFDTIFCISVFEHIPDVYKTGVLQEFQRTLKDDGLIVLTIDFPLATPDFMLAAVQEHGLTLAGPSDFTLPSNAIAGQGLHCYRLLLRKA